MFYFNLEKVAISHVKTCVWSPRYLFSNPLFLRFKDFQKWCLENSLKLVRNSNNVVNYIFFFRLSRLHVHGVHDDERLAHPSDQRPIRRQRTMSMNLQNFSVSVTFSHHLEALQRKKFLSISTVENDIIDTASCKVAWFYTVLSSSRTFHEAELIVRFSIVICLRTFMDKF